MARNLFAILDDLTANLAELKAALAPLALIGGTVVAEAKIPARAPRGAKAAGTPAGTLFLGGVSVASFAFLLPSSADLLGKAAWELTIAR